MTKPLRYRPQATADIEAIGRFLFGQSPEAAARVVSAVEQAYALLAEHPASGSSRHSGLFPTLPVPLRFHPIAGFPRVLIYYLDLPEALEIVRLWDAARGLDAFVEDTQEPE